MGSRTDNACVPVVCKCPDNLYYLNNDDDEWDGCDPPWAIIGESFDSLRC